MTALRTPSCRGERSPQWGWGRGEQGVLEAQGTNAQVGAVSKCRVGEGPQESATRMELSEDTKVWLLGVEGCREGGRRR